MSDLKRCPFCKNTVRIDEWYLGDCNKPLYRIVGCDPDCPCEFVADTMEELVKAWDTRPLEDALEQKLADMTAYADKLVDALPGGYLPKDIDVIRQANADFADEVHDLEAENKLLYETLELALADKISARGCPSGIAEVIAHEKLLQGETGWPTLDQNIKSMDVSRFAAEENKSHDTEN